MNQTYELSDGQMPRGAGLASSQMPGYAERNWSQKPGVSRGGGGGMMIAVGIDLQIRGQKKKTNKRTNKKKKKKKKQLGELSRRRNSRLQAVEQLQENRDENDKDTSELP